VDRIKGLLPVDNILIVTGKALAKATYRELPELPRRNIILEPCRRDTAAAVAIACAEIEKRGGENAVAAILTADHLMKKEAAFRRILAVEGLLRGRIDEERTKVTIIRTELGELFEPSALTDELVHRESEHDRTNLLRTEIGDDVRNDDRRKVLVIVSRNLNLLDVGVSKSATENNAIFLGGTSDHVLIGRTILGIEHDAQRVVSELALAGTSKCFDVRKLARADELVSIREVIDRHVLERTINCLDGVSHARSDALVTFSRVSVKY
jgi:hypothetical protein